MMRIARAVTGFCFCILLAAVVIFIFDIVVFSLTDRFLGCRFHTEIIPNIACKGALARPLEFVFNLPLFFILSPPALLAAHKLTPELQALVPLMFIPVVILVLGLIYPVLRLASRGRTV